LLKSYDYGISESGISSAVLYFFYHYLAFSRAALKLAVLSPNTLAFVSCFAWVRVAFLVAFEI